MLLLLLLDSERAMLTSRSSIEADRPESSARADRFLEGPGMDDPGPAPGAVGG